MATTTTRRTRRPNQKEADEDFQVPDAFVDPIEELKAKEPQPESEKESDEESEEETENDLETDLEAFAKRMAARQPKPEKAKAKQAALTPEQKEAQRLKLEEIENDRVFREKLTILGNKEEGYILNPAAGISPFGLPGLLPVFSRMTSYQSPKYKKPQQQRHVSVFCTAYLLSLIIKACFTEEESNGAGKKRSTTKNFLPTLSDSGKTIGGYPGVIYGTHEPSNSIGVFFNLNHKECPKPEQRLKIVKELIDFVNGFIANRVIIKSGDKGFIQNFKEYFADAGFTGCMYDADKDRHVVTIKPNMSYHDIDDLVNAVVDYCKKSEIVVQSPFGEIFALNTTVSKFMMQLMPFNDINFPTHEAPLGFDNNALDLLGFPAFVKSVFAFKHPTVRVFSTVSVILNKEHEPLEIVNGTAINGVTRQHLRTAEKKIVPAANHPIGLQIIDSQEDSCIAFSFYNGVNMQSVFKLIVEVLRDGVVV